MYRTAAVMASPDATVLCRACAVQRVLSLDAQRDDTFECATCRLEQPVLRGNGNDDLTVENMRVVSTDPGRYDDLVPFLKVLAERGGNGGTAMSVQVTVDCDGIPISLCLDINSGSVRGLEMVAQAAGLPAMVLLRETDEHRHAEEKGVVREVQIGDAEFDSDVYIESAAAERSVKTVFASPGARRATQELLRTTSSTIQITPAVVKVVVALEQLPFNPERILERLGWLRALAGAPRPLEVARVEMPAIARVVHRISWSMLPIGLLFAIASTIGFTPMNARSWIVGVISGFVIAAALQPLVTQALKGRATSLSEIKEVRILVFCAMPFVASGFLVFTNGAFDSSEARLIEMPVVSSNVDSDDSAKADVHTVDEWLESHVYSFDAPPPPPKTSKVLLHVKPGALGWRWHTDSAALVRGN